MHSGVGSTDWTCQQATTLCIGRRRLVASLRRPARAGVGWEGVGLEQEELWGDQVEKLEGVWLEQNWEQVCLPDSVRRSSGRTM